MPLHALNRSPRIARSQLVSNAVVISDGIRLIKYWLEVNEKEQARRFEARIEDPLRQWKLSPTDLESRRR